MATKKPKTTTTKKSKSTQKPKTAEKKAPVAKVVEEKKVEEKVTAKKESCLKGFFGKKYDTNESILTIFKNPKLYGALLGEVIGSMLLTLVLFALSLMGIANIAMYAIGIIAIVIAVYAFSGANLNPIVTVGMMASRRMSVIRGVLYIIAQIVGAWLGWMIFNAFHLAGGDSAYAIPAMAEVAEGNFWVVTLIELLGASIIAFCFARALSYKRSVFTFAAVVAGGMAVAVVAGYVVSAAFLGLSNNFVFNPAAALMFQIFPTAGESFGEVFGGIASALATYALFPMIGGVIGFYLSDFASKLSGEKISA